MPPRSKRKRTAAPARVTRSKGQAPNEQTTAEVSKSVNNEADSGPGPSTRRGRPHLIMEVVLPASKRPTPKTSSAPTPSVPDPPVSVEVVPELPSLSPLRMPEPIRESTPQVLGKGGKGEANIHLLPPSSPPPMSSPAQEDKWDNFSEHISTPTPSPSRSRRHSKESSAHPTETTRRSLFPTTHDHTLHPSSPSADVHPELEVVHSGSQSPQEEHKPPAQPDPPETFNPDDPFGFLAAENRLRERRIEMGIEGAGEERPSMLSSGGPESFDQSVYEEAFASIFDDPQAGTVAVPSETGSHRRSAHTSTEASLYDTDGNGDDTSKKLKRKRTMEVVIPTKGKGKEKAEENKQIEEAPEEPSPNSKSTRSKHKGKEKAKDPVITTYELEAMLPHRIRRSRKPRTSGETIALSDADSDEPSSPPKKSRATSAAKKKIGRSASKTTKKEPKSTKAGTSKVEKPVGRPPKRVRSGDLAEVDDDTRKRFEAERKRRLEAYKALDKYTLEEEEVVW